MLKETFRNFGYREVMGSGLKLFWYFQLFSFICLVIILFTACLGLRLILQRFVLYEAERDAIHISAAIRDSEISQLLQSGDAPKQYFSIPEEKILELDNNMRTFLAPFDIVKIKIFDSDTRIVYSTDPAIIGRVDHNNAKLLTALGGIPISKYESKDEVWDLEDEKRKNVEIVETYVPIYGTHGQVIGSFEIYKDVTYNLTRANKILFLGGGLLSATVLIVFIPLTFVLRRAIQTIKVSTFNLTRTNEQLQQEIVDRKQIGQSLQEAQRRFRDFFENAPIGFHIFGPDQIIMDINAAELQMIGYTKNEIVGKKTWADLILPEQKTEFKKHWHDIITKGQVRNLNYILVHKDGHQIDVLLNASARFDGKGNLINTRGSVLNITERKRLEKEFLNIIERERRRIGQELHDSIGQRLTGIEFMLESLERKLANKSLAEESSYTGKINTCVSQATEQTRNLAKGLHPVDLERNGLASALQELADNTEYLFNISCTMKCEEVVRIDDISKVINLYRIVQEAITNAVKHGKAKNIKIELVTEDGNSTLIVENDGLDFLIGQVQSEGMGLKIMQYRAEIINGSLDIHKGTDGGTVVTCVFTNKDDT